MPKKARSDADRRLRQNFRLSRILGLLRLLQGRGMGDAKALAAAMECSERTVFRDLQALEMAGIPWEFDQSIRSYRVQPGWHLSMINMSPDELLGQAMATAATSVPGLDVGVGAKPTTRRLSSSLSAQSQQILADAEQLIAVLDLKLVDHSRSLDVIRTIQGALLARKQVTGLYASPYQAKPTRIQRARSAPTAAACRRPVPAAAA
jgi:predicted DNA-binding transcriptional regulator YafY